MRDALATLPIPPRLLTATLLLLGVLMAPHAANLSPAIVGFFYAALAWRLFGQAVPRLLPGRWLLLLLMIGAVALVGVTTLLYDGRLAGTALLVVMLGLKLLELRARRDMHITVFLGYFLVLTQFLYNQSLWLAAYLLTGVLALTAIQVGLNRVGVDLRRQLRNTAAMLAAALPLALVVFLLFPRLHSPLWGINTQRASTGISDEMTLGDIGQLSQSNATAFRVTFLDEIPAPAQRYWRGPVLWETDGRRWSAGRRPVHALETRTEDPDAIGYEVTLEPTGEYWLFGLDLVTVKPPGALVDSNHALVGTQRVTQRLTYRAGSNPTLRIDTLSERDRRRALQLPAQVSPRVRALVEGWLGETGGGQPAQVVERALRHFRDNPFVYTLSPGTLQGDPVDRFLFDTRRGFCEHYAGSFALMMRLAGIPTRVVVGYQGGVRNPHADHWIVRQSDAHAWAEVWLPEIGWQRIDPTAAVAPERIEHPINAALSQDADRIVFADAGGAGIGGLWRNALWLADAVELGWHRWVVGFDGERQDRLLQRFGLDDLKGFGLAAALLVGGALAIGLVYLLAQLPRTTDRDPLVTAWQRLLAKLRRAGLQPAPWHGPDTVCAEAARAFPEAADELAAIRRMYVQLRYGRQRDGRLGTALVKRIRRLRLVPLQNGKG